jgi:hypothetical protein
MNGDAPLPPLPPASVPELGCRLQPRITQRMTSKRVLMATVTIITPARFPSPAKNADGAMALGRLYGARC